MEKYRKLRIITIIVLLVTIAGLSIGFAAFSEIFKISSSASVTPNASTFSVKFSTKQDELDESEVVPSDLSTGATAANGKISNTASPTISNLSAIFTTPGQYVEYTFYARNEGEYVAYLNNVNFNGEKTCTGGDDATDSLVQSACNAIEMTLSVAGTEYSETTAIMGHSLEKDTGEEVKVRISYDISGDRADGEFSVDFGSISMIYSSIDDSTFVPPVLESAANTKTINYVMKQSAQSDADVSFTTTPDTGIYVVSSTVNDTNPIYYYRGAVTDNNVLFANFCWKIVRTTETGGVKLIYNGSPAEDGSCANTGTSSQISTSAFNSSSSSPADVGYMYGTRYASGSQSLSSQSDTIIYGNKAIWDGTTYTLDDTYPSTSWSSDRTTLATKYHYTCFTSEDTCTSVYYIHYFGNSTTPYYLTFSNGITLETAKDAMFTNTTNSTIKNTIDTWYASNMTSYTSKLEDTIWCNDRSFYSGSLAGESVDAGTGYSYFGAYGRNVSTKSPSLTCPDSNDAFTVSSSNGNGSLTYPVGLLTADELTLAGSGHSSYSATSYLYTGQWVWSLSPSNTSSYSYEFSLKTQLYLIDGVYVSRGVRPSVSLAPNTEITSGDGSTSKPYVIG